MVTRDPSVRNILEQGGILKPSLDQPETAVFIYLLRQAQSEPEALGKSSLQWVLGAQVG